MLKSRALVAATAAALILAAPAGAATLAPSADSQVSAAHPQRNYGAAKRLVIARRPAQRAFLRFDLGGVPRPGAQLILHLYGLRFSDRGLDLRHASNRPWNERTITFRTALGTGPRVVHSGSIERHGWTLVDVTHLVDASGVVSLALSAAGRDAVVVASREAGAHAPRLEIDGGIAREPGAPALGESGSAHEPSAGGSAPQNGPHGDPGPQPQPQPQPGPPSSTTSPSSSRPCGVAAAAPAWQHVVWIVMENKAAGQIIGSSGAPYLNGLAAACGTATNFFAESHPSLPNYIAMTSGATQGITDDAAPSSHPLNVPSIFSQLGGDWRSLQESMPSNCAKSSSGMYAVKHNPAAYYTNIAAACATQDVPLGSTPDVAARFTLITPNLCSDMHDCSVSQGDAWLSTWVPRILDSPQYRSGTTAVFITFDEDDHSANNHIATVVVSPSTPVGLTDGGSYNHYSMLRTTEEMLGLPVTLGGAVAAMSMRPGMHL